MPTYIDPPPEIITNLSQKMTMDINEMNGVLLKKMINDKMGPTQKFVNPNYLCYVLTDVDHFPYTRHFRGRYNSDRPTVWSREAGYSPLFNGCYNNALPPKKGLPKDDIAFFDID